MATVRDGDPGIGRHGDGRCHARYDLIAQARRDQMRRLFPASPKNTGIATLEPGHRQSAARAIHQYRIRLLLGDFGISGTLARENLLRVGARPPQDARIAEIVINDDICGGHDLPGADRQQPGIARSSTDQVTDASCQGTMPR